jgi:hypothetical protein
MISYFVRFYFFFKKKLPFVILLSACVSLFSAIFVKEKMGIYLNFMTLLFLTEFLLNDFSPEEEASFKRFIKINGRNLLPYFCSFYIIFTCIFILNYISLTYISGYVAAIALNIAGILQLYVKFLPKLRQKILPLISIFIIFYFILWA